MRLIYVYGEDDFHAKSFEQSGLGVFEAYTEASSCGGVKEYKTEDCCFTVMAIDFGEVDYRFINFIKSEFIDHDLSKDRNFYIV